MILSAELTNAESALGSLYLRQAKAVETQIFWHKRLSYAHDRHQAIDAGHPRREHMAVGVRQALARYQSGASSRGRSNESGLCV